MSWFIALVPKNSPFCDQEIDRYRSQLERIVETPRKPSVIGPETLLFGGGLPETFAFKSSNDSGTSKGWLVCGIGIRTAGASFSAMDQENWNRLLQGEVSSAMVHGIDGHYVVATWKAGNLEIFADPLGLRRAYIATAGHFFVLSSRLDWVIPFLHHPDFSMDAVASEWNLMNSFSDDSLVKGVIRIGPSGHAKIEGGKLSHSWHHWVPVSFSDSRIDDLLSDATLFPLKQGHELTLGLSGGMDSRTILALLLGYNRSGWQVHSIGNRDNLDVMVAKRICDALRIPIQLHYYNLQESDTVDSVVGSLQAYSLHTEMTDSLFGYARLSLFTDMQEKGYWMTDGGYGELMRRSYGNRLLLSGRAAVRKNDPERFIKFFRRLRPPIFSREFENTLQLKVLPRFEAAFEAMPPSLLEGDFGDWIDVFHVRYRLKNFGGASQGLYDQLIPNYMPFALSKMISSYLTFPSGRRDNNKLNRRIIHKGEKALERFPLISYGAKVPYWTGRNIIISRVIGKLLKKSMPLTVNGTMSFRVKALIYIKDFVFDRLMSSDVKTCPFYDFDYLREHTERFYAAPSETDARVLDDWLTFDFWREHLLKR